MTCFQNKFIICLAAAMLAGNTATYAGESADIVKKRIGSGDPVAGKSKSTLCQGCHGDEGMSVENLIPDLAGQYALYIEKQLRDFQSGARKHQIMTVIAKTIDNADLADIAAYFSSQERMRGGGWGVSRVAKRLYSKGDKTRDILPCASCHGTRGKGKSPDIATYPVIGGQHKAYLRAQLINWRSGERSNSPDGVMNKIAKHLTDPEIDALTDYISGL